jgi:hypothetical protein
MTLLVIVTALVFAVWPHERSYRHAEIYWP